MDWYLFEAPGGDDADVDTDFDQRLFPAPPPLFQSSTPGYCLTVPATTSVTRMAAAGVSPSSSPRLPSPPPFTEVQIGPKSPTVGDSAGEQLFAPLPETDDGSTRRIRPGTKATDMASGPPLIPLSQLDSPFQLQEHLKALYHSYTMLNDSQTVHPITREVAVYLADPPEGVEKSLWLYELCRFLTMKVNNLIIAFFAEDPPCSAQTCPEMRASEWQYLCAVHDPPKSCCAIDYCCHTLDWATNILTSPKYFPSRLTLGSDAAGGPQASMRHLTNIFRRLYRIFAHAWFQHREVFRQVEGSDGLYVFFKTVCDVYSLIPEDNYTVPAEAEGSATTNNENENANENENEEMADLATPQVNTSPDERRFSILRKDADGVSHPHFEPQLEPPLSVSTGATTRRHKHSPSTGSSVTTIAEALEDSESTESKLSAVEENAALESPSEPPQEHTAEKSEKEKTPEAEESNAAAAGTIENAQPSEKAEVSSVLPDPVTDTVVADTEADVPAKEPEDAPTSSSTIESETETTTATTTTPPSLDLTTEETDPKTEEKENDTTEETLETPTTNATNPTPPEPPSPITVSIEVQSTDEVDDEKKPE